MTTRLKLERLTVGWPSPATISGRCVLCAITTTSSTARTKRNREAQEEVSEYLIP